MQNVELIFQQSGLKSTKSRLAVASILAQNNQPLTHLDLLKQLPNQFDRVTLYRILDWLLQHKVIHRIAGEDRAWRFQLNTSQKTNNNVSFRPVISKKQAIKQHNHAHFQCADCGQIFCLENVYPKISHDLPMHFLVDSIELNIKGKCANCQQDVQLDKF